MDFGRLLGLSASWPTRDNRPFVAGPEESRQFQVWALLLSSR